MPEVMEYISNLSVPERLQVMELLWKSLDADTYESPEWHKDVLAERLQRVESGEGEFMSLAESKRRLAERVRAS